MAKRFRQDELENIIKDYKNGIRPYELEKKYNRSSSSIIYKLQDLGIYKNANYRFSKEDVEYLKKYYPIGGMNLVKERFKNVSVSSIRTKVSKLNIKDESFFWSSEDIDFLKKNCNKLSYKELYNHYRGKYTLSAIQTKAGKLNLLHTRAWTEEENNIMLEFYPKIPVDDVCKMLPGRTRDAIIGMALKLGVTSVVINDWTPEEDLYIEEHWELMPDVIIAKNLNRTFRATKSRRGYLGFYRQEKLPNSYQSISKFFRGRIGTWKTNSMRNCDYKCIFTGSKDFEIHHIYMDLV